MIHDNPVEAANNFAEEASMEGFLFDFSLKSLESEVDKYLDKYCPSDDEKRPRIECDLTAYVGETIRRLYKGEWAGEYFGKSSSYRGPNFYTCKVKIGKYDFYPSHFISYYVSNGKESEGTFYDYLHNRDRSNGISRDFLGGGLLEIIEKKK